MDRCFGSSFLRPEVPELAPGEQPLLYSQGALSHQAPGSFSPLQNNHRSLIQVLITRLSIERKPAAEQVPSIVKSHGVDIGIDWDGSECPLAISREAIHLCGHKLVRVLLQIGLITNVCFVKTTWSDFYVESKHFMFYFWVHRSKCV